MQHSRIRIVPIILQPSRESILPIGVIIEQPVISETPYPDQRVNDREEEDAPLFATVGGIKPEGFAGNADNTCPFAPCRPRMLGQKYGCRAGDCDDKLVHFFAGLCLLVTALGALLLAGCASRSGRIVTVASGKRYANMTEGMICLQA